MDLIHHALPPAAPRPGLLTNSAPPKTCGQTRAPGHVSREFLRRPRAQALDEPGPDPASPASPLEAGRGPRSPDPEVPRPPLTQDESPARHRWLHCLSRRPSLLRRSWQRARRAPCPPARQGQGLRPLARAHSSRPRNPLPPLSPSPVSGWPGPATSPTSPA